MKLIHSQLWEEVFGCYYYSRIWHKGQFLAGNELGISRPALCECQAPSKHVKIGTVDMVVVQLGTGLRAVVGNF